MFYNRIGKAGSSTVMYTFKALQTKNGFKLKEGITSEYLTPEGCGNRRYPSAMAASPCPVCTYAPLRRLALGFAAFPRD